MSIHFQRGSVSVSDFGSPRSSIAHADVALRSSVTALLHPGYLEKEASSFHVDGTDLEKAMESTPRKDAKVQTEKEEDLPQPVKVPHYQRTGLLAGLSIIAEVEDPKHHTRPNKWAITLVVGFAAIAAPIGSTVILSSLPDITAEFQTNPIIANLCIALYMLALGIFPLFWSSFSETLGRRTIYIISFFLFNVFNIMSAEAKSISMLIILRSLAGGASGSVQAVGAGTIADIWHVKERGKAMAIFYIGPMMGPLLAPIIGGSLQLKWGWRSTMWFLVLYGVIAFALLLFCLPETHKSRKPFLAEDDLGPSDSPGDRSLPRVVSRKKQALRLSKAIFVEPLMVVQYLQFPVVAITIYYASITFGTLYLLQVAIQSIFSSSPYNFSSLGLGFCYTPVSLGYVASSLFAGRWTDKVMAREAEKAGRYDECGRLIYRPEDRMRENVWLAALIYPVALVIFGWTSQEQLHWAIPLTSNFFFGLGTMTVFSTVTTMLTEFMPKKAASMVALNNFCRNTLSAAGCAIAQPLLDAIGIGWTFTIFGSITLASSVILWAMKHYGPTWRVSMEKKLLAKGL